MSVKKIDQQTMNSWVDGLISQLQVFGVQAKAERFSFEPLKNAADLKLDYDVTIIPPKKYFLPEKEDILTFKDGKYTGVIADQPFVLFGVHPYDMVAISQMDTIFSEKNYDVHYMKKRENAVIVVCDVKNPSANVFAGCMDAATVDKGFDVLITAIKDGYVVDSRTKKGEKLMEGLKKAPNADGAALAERDSVQKKNKKDLCKHQLKPALKALPELLGKSMDHPVWAKKAESCFSCGSCNLVCPTCYCFDVRDDFNWDLKSGKRERTWDGCMLSDFASVAGGHNFRSKKADRFRHRYYRKGKYMPEKIGMVACVGCGRCIGACVAKIANPVEIFNELEVK